MKTFILSFIFILFGQLSWAQDLGKVVLISDIDDTIKISHVLEMPEAIIRGASDSSAFLGMPELYQLIVKETGASVYYLTNAPDYLMSHKHEELVSENHFPAGQVILRSGLSVAEHKLTHIREIIQNERPDEIIMLGDNGERDIEVYDEIQKEYPQIHMHQFIRTLYSREEHPEILTVKSTQTNFISPVEVALALGNADLISEYQTHQFVMTQLKQILAHPFHIGLGAAYFTSWMSTAEYRWNLNAFVSEYPLLRQYKSYYVRSVSAQ